MRNIKSILTLALFAVVCFALPAISDTAPPNGGWDAAWSPDGATIAFASGSPHSPPNLWLVKADGNGLRQMTTKGAHEPQWLPNSSKIVFGTLRNGKSIYMEIDAKGEPDSEKAVEALPAGAESPVWSPDGSLVAYGAVSKDGSSRDLTFARMGGGGSTGLTSKFWCREWTWSPDGATIAFVIGRSAGASIWTANVATKDLRLLYKGFCAAPRYSPDGKKLALAVPDVRSGFKIVVVDLATGLDKRIGVRSFGGSELIWSVDGKRLFFESSRKSEPAIWSVGADGKDLNRITSQGMPSSQPSLSADGTKLAYQVSMLSSYSPELSVCSTAGQVLAKLTSSSPSFWSPVWSPDGKELAFQSDVNHGYELFVGPPTAHPAKPCTRIYSPDPVEVSWFSNGKTLLVADSGRLLMVNKSGGKDAAKPLPKLTANVQGARLSGDEVIVTEWGIRDAAISAFKLDGSGRRSITQKRAEKTEPQPSKDKVDGGTPDLKPPKAASAPSSTSANVGSGPASVASAETGNPHSDLGLMGPQPDVNQAQPPAVIDLWPAVSPDRKSVAFARNDQVWLVNADGTGERQITKFAPVEGVVHTIGGPCWSPKGDSLLFFAFNNASGRMTLEIWTCRPEAGSERLVYSEAVDTEYGVYYSECTNPPAFMAGASRIIFTSISGGQPRIVSVATDGSGLREMVLAPSSFPALNASESKLAYVDLSNSGERIRVMDMATGQSTGALFGK